MTPLQAAKAHCANYQPDGSCLGIYYNRDLSIDRASCRPCGKCLLADDQRCTYFEEIILPMQMSRETAQAVVAADKKDSAVKHYLTLHHLIPSRQNAKKVCLACRRVEVEGKEKYCYRCAVKRKRSSYRLSKQRSRSFDVQKNPNSPIGAEALTKPDVTGHYGSSGHAKFGSLTVVTREAAFAKLREISR
jgi:hypothetical protein